MLQAVEVFFKDSLFFVKKKLNLHVFCLLIGCLLVHTGCQPQKEAANTVNICLVSDPESLSSQTTSTIPFLVLVRHLSEGLVRIHPEKGLEPALAETITVSQDGLRYHIVLRDQLCWDKHHPLTTLDFERSYKQLLSQYVQSKLVDQLFIIKNAKAIYQKELPEDSLGIRVLNSREFEIELEQASPAFMYQLSTPLFFPVPEKYEPSQAGGVSCGAYYLSSWQHQKQLVLKKNSYYWDAKNVHLDEIRCMILPDENTQLIMFSEGLLDFCGSPLGMLPMESLQDPEVLPYISSFSEPTINMLVFNNRSGPFSFLKMRQAFSLGIDRENLVKEGLYPGSPATAFIPAEIMGENTSYFSSYDSKKAKLLFEEALVEMGCTRQTLPPIKLLYLSKGPHGKRCQAIEDNWYKLFGIHVQLIALEWGLHNSSLLSGDFDVATASWVADFPDASNFLQIYYERQGGRNYPGWQNKEYQDAFDRALACSDPQERKKHFLKAERVLMEQMVVAPVAFPASPYVCSPRLKGVYCNPMGYVDFRWAYIEE